MMQEVSTSPACEVIILTALPVEFQAVLEHLQETREIIHPQGTIYRTGSFVREFDRLQVAVAQVGMGGGSAAVETERAIHFFHPHLLLFVGIAGGLKDVQLGDVVAATKVYAYESGKAGQKFGPRPEVWRASYSLEQRARHEVSNKAWLGHLKRSILDPAPRAYVGALAAGEKVLASTQSAVYRQIKATYNDALAIEMEGHGFLQAIHVNHDMYGLVIRGISDLIDNKAIADARGAQSRAARNAAAFAFQVLATFTFSLSSLSLSSFAPHSIWNVPYPRNPYFTGRDDLIDRLSQQLTSEAQEQRTMIPQAELILPYAITGLGGIGKTQVAVEYAYRARSLRRYMHTFWVNAANKESILTSFVEIAALLPAFAARNETDQRKLITAVKRWLEQCQQPWLLIFDNIDHDEDLPAIREYLPQKGNGSILLTTRISAVGSLATPIEVETMGFIEGTQLLLRRAQRFAHASDEEVNQAGNIVAALDHFPLALDQAGAYIEETQCSFEAYLDLYQTHRQELLAKRGKIATDYPGSVATTWSLSFQKVQQANAAAIELLELCAFLAPDRIPEELLKGGAIYWPVSLQQAVGDPLLFQQLMADLLKFSLVKRLVEEHTLSIHRLVQAVQRERLEMEVQRRWAERAVQALNAVFPENPQDATTWSQCLRYLDQMQACHALMAHYELTLVAGASVFNRAGLYLFAHALYALAEQLYQRAFILFKQQLGPNHPDTMNSLNNLAHLYDRLGKYDLAEQLHEQAVAVCEQQMGAEHIDTAKNLARLADAYVRSGKRNQAVPLYERALAICEQQLGAEHPDIAPILVSLAQEYGWQELENCWYKPHERGVPLYERALVIYLQQLKDASPENIVKRLRSVQVLLNRPAQVEALDVVILEISEKLLGEEHPDTASSLDEIARWYEKREQYGQAQSFFRRALLIRKRLFGLEHPDTAYSLFKLASILDRQEEYKEEASQLYKQAYAIHRRLFGIEHPVTQVLQLLLKNYHLNED